MQANVTETGRNKWIAAPNTKGWPVALGAVLIAICLMGGGFMVATSLPAPANVQDFGLPPIL
jgi:hypothetical protein